MDQWWCKCGCGERRRLTRKQSFYRGKLIKLVVTVAYDLSVCMEEIEYSEYAMLSTAHSISETIY
jgi:hypothetical protein